MEEKGAPVAFLQPPILKEALCTGCMSFGATKTATTSA